MKRFLFLIFIQFTFLSALATSAESSDQKCSAYLKQSAESIWEFRSPHCLDYRQMIAKAPEGYEETTDVAKISSDTQTDGSLAYVLVFGNGMRADGSLERDENPRLRDLLASARKGTQVRLRKIMGAPSVCSEQAAIAHGLGIWRVSINGRAANEILTFTGTTRQCGGSGIYGLKNPDTDELTKSEEQELERRKNLIMQRK